MSDVGLRSTPAERSFWLAGLTPEEARKGSRILGRFNDWLVDTNVGALLSDEQRQWLGGLMVECNRIVREAPEEPKS